MDFIECRYRDLVLFPSDINEHLPTLFRYAQECDSVFETGVRECVSSWAFVYGLLLNSKKCRKKKFMLLNDICECNIKELTQALLNENIILNYIWKNNLELTLNRRYDLTFIDTWHVYGQLKRELEKFSKITNKYIIMHDTTVDEVHGETIRQGWNSVQQSLESGFLLEEVNKGLWQAIEEFLHDNPEWILHERFTNNNGLTILKRTKIYPISFSIPRIKITDKINSVSQKEKIISDLIPGNYNTYSYDNEEKYYNEYKKSLFALTSKKFGWDCLRHYEIIANGCIPYFPDIEQCPKNTMVLFPKELIKIGNDLYNICINYNSIYEIPRDIELQCNVLINKLTDSLKDYLTTKKMAEYILEKTDHKNVSSVLFLSGCLNPDYLRCLTLHGFKETLGNRCHDYPKIPHIYKSETNNYKILYGKGFTYTNLLEDSLRNDELDNKIEEDIINHKYDVVIYGSYNRGMPYYNLVCSSYKSEEIILMCGDDSRNFDHSQYAKEGHHVFVREL